MAGEDLLGQGGRELDPHHRLEPLPGGLLPADEQADTLEALIGAAYLEHGIDAASDLVHRLVDGLLDSSAALGAGLDWKTSLQELTATHGLGVPEYAVEEEGPDHAKTFHAVVRVGGVVRGHGTGRSKKEAEQQAAATAFAGITAQLAAAAQQNGKAQPDGKTQQDGVAPVADA